MGTKYTAIFNECFNVGSQRQTLTQFLRMEKRENETVEDMLKREGIAGCDIFIFVGHPLLEGEESGELAEK